MLKFVAQIPPSSLLAISLPSPAVPLPSPSPLPRKYLPSASFHIGLLYANRVSSSRVAACVLRIVVVVLLFLALHPSPIRSNMMTAETMLYSKLQRGVMKLKSHQAFKSWERYGGQNIHKDESRMWDMAFILKRPVTGSRQVHQRWLLFRDKRKASTPDLIFKLTGVTYGQLAGQLLALIINAESIP